MSSFYVTTSIPYINGEPHLGHAWEFLIADVIARYARAQNIPTLFSTGTDEHGSKVAEKAEELGISPKELADKNVEKFREMLQVLGITNDRFIRTTDKAHEQRAQLIWKALSKDIYKGAYIGWYCTGCEEFVTEAVAKERKGTCPNHEKPYEKIEEENYFFKLSSYGQQIAEKIESDEFRVIPKSRKNEILSVLKSGIEDISISRPKEKISWGVPVPGDTTQVMYVWFEALMNYITVIGYPEHEDFKKFWPANYQVIGKDILRFHAAIWPGMLMSLGLQLPKALYVHGFITLNGQKMSKSTGNVIDPKEVVDKYGVDAFRYYLLRKLPSYSDGDFSWEHFEESYNAELGNELGNAVQRTIVMIEKFQDGMIGEIPESGHDKASYHAAIKDCRFDQAMDEVWNQVRGLNQYIDEQKPWAIAKEEDKEHLQDVLAYMVSCLVEISELLMPFLPNTAQAINNIFAEGLIRKPQNVLFPKIEDYKTKEV
jgi:methionyl-tRNA synthetase